MPGLDFIGVPGDVLLYRAGTIHEESAETGNPLETRFISWEGEPGPALPVRVRDTGGRIREMSRWLHEEWTSGSAGGKLRDLFFQAMIVEWERLATVTETDMVKRVRDRMAAAMDRKVTLDELAVVGELSKYHFVRTYHTLTGRTPMQDLQAMRIRHAHSLLLTSDLTQKEIAGRTGLGNIYYLSRVFKRHFGMSPGALRSGRKHVR